MSYCPFQQPITYSSYNHKRDIDMWEDDTYKWQKCGEACELYSAKLQECVFETIANRLGNITEMLDNIAESAERT